MTMRRRTALGLGVVLTMVSAFGLFQVKHHVQQQRNDLKNLTQQLEYEKETLHVLKAEWTYLNQPERLHALVNKHLQLTSMRVSQVVREGASDRPMLVRNDKPATRAHPAFMPANHSITNEPQAAADAVPVALFR
jgi:cell division protein FtsL